MSPAGICPKCLERPVTSPGQSYCHPCRREYNFNSRRRRGVSEGGNTPAKRRAYRHEFPEKHNAQEAVQRALKKGVLVRPSICEECGKAPSPRRNGASGIEAHHTDYSKPLQVMWLCQSCHMILHAVTVKVETKTALKFS